MHRYAIALASLLFVSACSEGLPDSGSSQDRTSENLTELNLGATRHLTVYLGETCGVAPSFAEVEPQLPVSQIVTYSDGGIGTRNSRRCGGATDGRVVLATGIAPGTETHDFQAGLMSIVVN